MNSINYTLRLASALRAYNLTHPFYDVLMAVLHLQDARGHATIPSTCLALSCTYQNVVQHILKNPDLFDIETPAGGPRRIRLTPEAVRLLARVKERISRDDDPPAEDSTGTCPTT